MQYLAALGGGSCGMEHAILQTNCILEAFGNAKTSRNDNASRFVSSFVSFVVAACSHRFIVLLKSLLELGNLFLDDSHPLSSYFINEIWRNAVWVTLFLICRRGSCLKFILAHWEKYVVPKYKPVSFLVWIHCCLVCYYLIIISSTLTDLILPPHVHADTIGLSWLWAVFLEKVVNLPHINSSW